MLLQALRSILYPLVHWNWSYCPETPNLGQIRRFLEPCDLEIWRMTLKNNRATFLCYFKLCAAFRSHLMNSIWSYSPETHNLGQIRRFLAPCDLEIWRMTLKNGQTDRKYHSQNCLVAANNVSEFRSIIIYALCSYLFIYWSWCHLAINHAIVLSVYWNMFNILVRFNSMLC